MGAGIPGFIHREMKHLSKAGFKFSIFYTVYGEGPYMPNSNFKVNHFTFLSLILSLFRYILFNPKNFSKIFLYSLRTQTFRHFVLAINFSESMLKDNIDKIHCHFGGNKLLIGFYCKMITHKSLSVTIHAYELQTERIGWESKFNNEAYKEAISFCDKIITISQWNKDKLLELYDLSDSDVEVIRLSAIESNKLKNEFRILIVGNSFERKGHETLFRAVKELSDSRIKVWVVSQTGPINLENLSKEVGISEQVDFFGGVSHENLKLIYLNCDIFCLPCRHTADGDHEGIPVSLMDAMQIGKPVISTRHTGIPELVEDVLVDEGDYIQLSKSIKNLMDDKPLRDKLGQRNKQIISDNYSHNNINTLGEYFQR